MTKTTTKWHHERDKKPKPYKTVLVWDDRISEWDLLFIDGKGRWRRDARLSSRLGVKMDQDAPKGNIFWSNLPGPLERLQIASKHPG